MTLQQKRRAMAEACSGIFTFPEFMSVRPPPGTPLWRDTGAPVTEREWLYAVHLAVSGLDLKQIVKFSDILKAAIQDEHCITSAVDARYMTVNANESQRIDAFLKVKGLWREGE